MQKDYQTITCHFCFESFEVDLDSHETYSGRNTEIYDCVLCCNPNKLDYEVYQGIIINIDVSSGNE